MIYKPSSYLTSLFEISFSILLARILFHWNNMSSVSSDIQSRYFVFYYRCITREMRLQRRREQSIVGLFIVDRKTRVGASQLSKNKLMLTSRVTQSIEDKMLSAPTMPISLRLYIFFFIIRNDDSAKRRMWKCVLGDVATPSITSHPTHSNASIYG